MAEKCGCTPGIEFTHPAADAEPIPGIMTISFQETGITYCPLHAAAPTLLEALEELADEVDRNAGTEDLQGSIDTDPAHAAIDAAKG